MLVIMMQLALMALSIQPTSPVTLSLGVGELKLDFVQIQAGTFTMGDNATKPIPILDQVVWGGSPLNAWPERQVTITRDFYIGKTPVTVAQYCDFLNGRLEQASEYVVLHSRSRLRVVEGRFEPVADAEDNPVPSATWAGAVAFCEWLSAESGFTFRLPTEAEWEFAARGPDSRTYAWGNEWDMTKEYCPPDLNEQPFWPVGSFPANATPEGVLDFGSVREWCSDYYAQTYDPADVTDPKGPANGEYRVLRGVEFTPADRALGGLDPEGDSGDAGGFRVLMESDPPDADR